MIGRKKGIKNIKKSISFLESYKYSSYIDFININERKESKILNIKISQKYFSNVTDFNKEILNWLECKEI